MRRQAGDSDESALLATDERAAGSDCYQAARMPWHAPLVPLPSLTSVAGAPDRDRPLCRSLRLLRLRDTHGESNETDKKIRRASERATERVGQDGEDAAARSRRTDAHATSQTESRTEAAEA